MSVPAKRKSAMSRLPWIPTWGADTLGYVKDVDPSGMKPLTAECRIGELDDILIDAEIYGLEGTIKMVLHEVDPERIRQLCPWAGASGAFSIGPSTQAYSMYDNAKPLVLHPRGVTGTASDQSYGWAFPIFTWPKSGGAKVWKELPVEFYIFPSRTAIEATPSTLVYGYQGPLPP